jgi:hypothetical protein
MVFYQLVDYFVQKREWVFGVFVVGTISGEGGIFVHVVVCWSAGLGVL